MAASVTQRLAPTGAHAGVARPGVFHDAFVLAALPVQDLAVSPCPPPYPASHPPAVGGERGLEEPSPQSGRVCEHPSSPAPFAAVGLGHGTTSGDHGRAVGAGDLGRGGTVTSRRWAPALTLPFLSPSRLSPLSPPPARLCLCLSVHVPVRPSVRLSLVSLLLLSGTAPSRPVTRGTSSSRALFVVDLFQLLDLRPNSMLLLNKLPFGSWLWLFCWFFFSFPIFFFSPLPFPVLSVFF